MGVIVTSLFAIMHSNSLTEVNMNEVTIVENGGRNIITTEVETVLDLITEGYLQLGNFDKFNVGIEDVVYDGMEIEITRANPVIINDGGTRFQIMTTQSDVFTVLDKHDIELGDDDLMQIVMTALNSEGDLITLNPNSIVSLPGSTIEIEVTRVEFNSESTFEEFVLETEYFYTDELRRGYTEVRVEGSPRIEETVIESEYRNGEFYTIVSEETFIVDEGVNERIAIGTYVPAPPRTTASVNSTAPAASLDSFTASVTAYTACCVGCSGWTANATDVRHTTTFYDGSFGTVRVLAADPRFPFGTIIYISGVGNGIVLDRGSAVRGNVLDLLMWPGDNPLQFGRQSLQAQVVRLGW